MYVLDKITNWSDLLQCRRIDLVRGGGGVVLFNLCQRLIDWFGGPPFLPPRVRLGKGLCLSGVLYNTEHDSPIYAECQTQSAKHFGPAIKTR